MSTGALNVTPPLSGSSPTPPLKRKAAPTSTLIPKPALYTTGLIYAAVQIAFISFLSSYYNVGVSNASTWIIDKLEENEYTSAKLADARNWVQDTFYTSVQRRAGKKKQLESGKAFDPIVPIGKEYSVFSEEQLALFDGTRSSRPVYLAIVGRVYDVDKGKKHYGKGGGYSFFAGKDATRAFVSGDFTPEGLRDDVEGLSHDDILGIRDWVSFYERDYKLVGVLAGRYYDAKGAPTEETQTFLSLVNDAADWRDAKAKESEVFPPCNSEWHKDSAGRVWCTTKSGGIERKWAGLPRLFTDPSTKQQRCVCVKNYGEGLSPHKSEGGKRGDLDHPALTVYPNCKETSNSCKVEND